jgi:hypothetical protein
MRRNTRMAALVDIDSLSRGALDGSASGRPGLREHAGGAEREHHQDRNLSSAHFLKGSPP